MDSTKTDNELCDESTLTLEQVIDEEKRLLTEARAVLGDADDNVCSYLKGYIQRQPLYACTSCVAANMEPAGVCLACSLHCHDGHDLVELYTKRKFRCDCGNKKFPVESKCELNQEKDDFNDKNKYSQNFRGLYCTCSRPYPDPDCSENDDAEMIQCCVCEDWFHSTHLNLPAGAEISDDYEEMICQNCITKHSFLLEFQQDSQSAQSQNESTTNIDTSTNGAGDSDKSVIHLAEVSKVPEQNSSVCAFFDACWREKICNCDACKNFLAERGLSFLLNLEDCVSYYEAQNVANDTTQDSDDGGCNEALTAFLGTLSRNQQLDMIHEYNHLKEELETVLSEHVRKRKVVTEDDVKEFFERLRSEKRPRVDIPDNCR